MAPQNFCLAPLLRIPDSDGLVGCGRDQLAAIARKLQMANPGSMTIEPDQHAAGLSVPDPYGGIFKARSRGQDPSVGRNCQSGQAEIPLWFGLPEFPASDEIEALDAV